MKKIIEYFIKYPAAGNVVIIKPSEMTPNSSALLKEMMAELFEENEVAVVEGDAETAMELQELPFNHIFFTGSPAVGKHVMAAAAKHLLKEIAKPALKVKSAAR